MRKCFAAWLGWTAATLLGWILGYGLATVVTDVSTVSWLVIGAVIGLAQWVVLRRLGVALRLYTPALWVASSGLALRWLMDSWSESQPGTPVLLLALAGVIALIHAVPQRALSRHPQAGGWLATLLTVAGSAALLVLVSRLPSDGGLGYEGRALRIAVGIIGAVAWACAGAVTGVLIGRQVQAGPAPG